ncbi:hypothetical protein [uncultured Phascolarctobacterium sp.]|jgi:hypothetical protein|uniref:hypothetical protein n=1 Tax=uncultured Phascolarctobacterium sp. TaxID=512296 RepID=UPI0015B1F12F|nr:hypothetical protein [uncultured Phascolarctobacterium sp.]DAE91818.1 MAG TPA: hypothetical protein [Caudoviricetes sp.]
MINDGTVKWEIKKITDSENSELLEGKTVIQIINETLGNVPAKTSVSVITGNVWTTKISDTSGGLIRNFRMAATIPLPDGYIREQCRYFIDRNQSYLNQATGYYEIACEIGDSTYNISYICIAVK